MPDHALTTTVLRALMAADRPRSGGELGAIAGVSRARVWQAIEQLRQLGHTIHAVAGVGYRWVEDGGAGEKLEPVTATATLSQRLPWLGPVTATEETDSTNVGAMMAIRTGQPTPWSLWLTDRQTAGRGRLGRTWITPPGRNLAFSLILTPPWTPAEAASLTLTTAVALYDALCDVAPSLAPDLKIKWPNDLMLQGRKLAGILTELEAEIDRIHGVVIGVGVNVLGSSADLPEELAQRTVTLQEVLGRKIDRLALLIAFLERLRSIYQRHLDEGFEPIRQAWWQRAGIERQRVSGFDKAHPERIASVVGIDPNGALQLLDEQAQLIRISAGELTWHDLAY